MVMNVLRGFALGFVVHCAVLIFGLVVMTLVASYGVVPMIYLIKTGLIDFPPDEQVLRTLRGIAASGAIAAFVITTAGMPTSKAPRHMRIWRQ